MQGLLEMPRRALRRRRRAAARALCMDKVVFKDAHGAAGLPQVATRAPCATASDPAPRRARSGCRCLVKPARLGSSVGIAQVERAGRARRRAARRVRARPARDRRGDGARARGRVLGARQPTTPSASQPGEIVLLGGSPAGTTTRRSTRRAAWSSSCRRGSPTRARERVRDAGRRGVHARRLQPAWPASTSSSTATTCSLNELNTMPGFTADERLREALGRLRRRRTRSCSTGCARSRSSATSASARYRF